MNKTLKQLASSVLVAITAAISPATHCMEEKAQENPSREFLLFQALRTGELIKEVGQISDLNIHILKDITVLSLLSQPTNEWSAVCKEYPCIMQKHKIEIFQLAICQIYAVDPETCERFLKGKLIYKPNENNDIGRIELCISDLANPLEGTFDLSQCGDAGQHLSISTGYRKGTKAENAKKVEIWFAPRFLIEKELNTTASHFKGIFPSYWLNTVPIGIVWTWGGWNHKDWYDYLVNQTIDEVGNNNLYKAWYSLSRHTDLIAYSRFESFMNNILHSTNFSCSFL